MIVINDRGQSIPCVVGTKAHHATPPEEKGQVLGVDIDAHKIPMARAIFRFSDSIFRSPPQAALAQIMMRRILLPRLPMNVSGLPIITAATITDWAR